MSHEAESLVRQSGALLQIPAHEFAMSQSDVREPRQAALANSLLQRLTIVFPPKFCGRDAMVIKQNTWLSLSEKGQQSEKGEMLAVFNDHQVGIGQKLPALTHRLGRIEPPTMSCQGRMKVVVRLQANADVGPALEKERQFFGNLVADGLDAPVWRTYFPRSFACA